MSNKSMLDRAVRSRVSDTTREFAFAGGILLGTGICTLGIAFLIIGISMNTHPPAPYFVSATDQYITVGVASLAILVGVGIARRALRLGWW